MTTAVRATAKLRRLRSLEDPNPETSQRGWAFADFQASSVGWGPPSRLGAWLALVGLASVGPARV